MKASRKYLLDSNVLIRSLHKGTRDNIFIREIPINSICVSVVTVAEVLVKMSKTEEKGIERILSSVKILAIDEEIARKTARLRKKSFKIKRAYLQDCFIAATAMVNKLYLVTNNVRDFRFSGLKIMNPNAQMNN